MTKVTHQRLDTLTRQKKGMLRQLSGWSEAQLSFRPNPTQWSALDMLDHLVKVEKAAHAAVFKNLPRGHPITLKDRLGAQAVFAVMRSPIRVKVPAAASVVLPEQTADLPKIEAHWNNVRQEILELLNSLQPPQFQVGLFRHPVSGWMTITGALTFLSVHLKHHEYQLDRIRQTLGSCDQ